jgi:hypothetical protein
MLDNSGRENFLLVLGRVAMREPLAVPQNGNVYGIIGLTYFNLQRPAFVIY